MASYDRSGWRSDRPVLPLSSLKIMTTQKVCLITFKWLIFVTEDIYSKDALECNLCFRILSSCTIFTLNYQKRNLDAVRALDGREICGQRVRVEMRKDRRRIGSEHSEQKLRFVLTSLFVELTFTFLFGSLKFIEISFLNKAIKNRFLFQVRFV